MAAGRLGLYNPGFALRVPSHLGDPTPADAPCHDRIVSLVVQMLDLRSRLAAQGIPPEKAALQRWIEMTNRQIELCELTAEEIAVVEGNG